MSGISGIHIAVLVVLVVVAEGASLPRFDEGTIGYKYEQVRFAPDEYLFVVTDGQVLIRALVSKDDIINCSIHNSHNIIKETIGQQKLQIKHIGKSAIQEMTSRCESRSLHPGHSHVKRQTTHISANSTLPPPVETGLPAGSAGDILSGILVLNGTKWCGGGNTAANESDFGIHMESDKCCRVHDKCGYFINGFSSRYHFTNIMPWSLSYCDCDQVLYDCLKAADTPMSNSVGQTFWDNLQVQCFIFVEGEYCAERHWSQLWCERTEIGVMAEVHYQGPWDRSSTTPGATTVITEPAATLTTANPPTTNSVVG